MRSEEKHLGQRRRKRERRELKLSGLLMRKEKCRKWPRRKRELKRSRKQMKLAQGFLSFLASCR